MSPFRVMQDTHVFVLFTFCLNYHHSWQSALILLGAFDRTCAFYPMLVTMLDTILNFNGRYLALGTSAEHKFNTVCGAVVLAAECLPSQLTCCTHRENPTYYKTCRENLLYQTLFARNTSPRFGSTH